MRLLKQTMLWAGLGLLVACQGLPIAIPVPDAEFPLASVPTLGRVLVYAQPLTFDRPPIAAQYVIEGQATYQQRSLSLEIYGSIVRPTGCDELPGGYLLCNPNAPGTTLSKMSTEPLNFAASATRPFRLQGEVLNRGVTQGQLWMGVQIDTLQPGQGTMRLQQMVAKIAVF